MTPEAERFLAKAKRLVEEAQTMLTVDLFEAAGRTAYLAAFHAAQALIFERTGKVFKTHGGVHSEFQRLTKDNEGVKSALRAFLSRAYNLKAVADYEIGPDSGIPADRATDATMMADQFVDWISESISEAR